MRPRLDLADPTQQVEKKKKQKKASNFWLIGVTPNRGEEVGLASPPGVVYILSMC